MISLRLTLAAVIAASSMSTAVAQSVPVQHRIARVEQGLTPTVQVEGRAYPPESIPDLLRRHNVPSVSIAVINDDRIEWARAWGLADVASGRSATPETLYQAASISKPVAAMAALDMVEAGLINLDAPINAGLVSWKVPDNAFTAAEPVTLRRVLSHSAGLTVHGFPGYAEGAALPTVVQILNGKPPANTRAVVVNQTPGQAFRYSGGGITAAQLLMTDVAGQPFPELMRSRVLGPLGMTDSGYEQPLPADRHARAATAYGPGAVAVPGRFHTYPEMAAAGLWTTPTDLARWLLGLADAHAGRSDAVLDQTIARAMLTPGLEGWGLAIGVADAGPDLKVSHGGANEGYRANMIGFPERGQGLVIMTNSDLGGALMGPLLQAVATEYGWPGHAPRMIALTEVGPDVLAALAGRYQLGGDTVAITVAEDGRSLRVTLPDSDSLELIPQGDDRFLDTRGASPFQFGRDADGKVASVTGWGATLQRLE